MQDDDIDNPWPACPKCLGSGVITIADPNAPIPKPDVSLEPPVSFVRTFDKPCTVCKGTGRLTYRPHY